MTWPQIGDAIEVKFMQMMDGAFTPEELWLPATVCHVDSHQIGVAFSDGERMALPRNSGQGRYRKPSGLV
ncbi:MAG: hypothetical protein EBS50_12025 [Sphingomonadaceae bacterium]|nr:hypothetical protein [Sphingomonadaceae bacterium]